MLQYCTKAMLAATLICAASSFAQTDDGYADPSYGSEDTQSYAAPAPAPVAAPAPQQNNAPIYVNATQGNQIYAVPQQNNAPIYVNATQPNQGYAAPQQNYNQGYNNGYNQNYAAVPVAQPPKTGRTLQALQFALPIETVTWEIDDSNTDIEYSSIGFEFNWTRFRVNDNGYSSLFGLSIGYVTGETEGKRGIKGPDMDGMDFNLKFGWGMAPVAKEFIFAFHIFMGFDIKALEGEFDDTDEYEDYDYNRDTYVTTSRTVSLEYSSTYISSMLGGDLLLAYQINNSFALVGGIDISTNLAGFGVFSYDYGSYSDNSDPITFMFSGINIVPHIGISFVY